MSVLQSLSNNLPTPPIPTLGKSAIPQTYGFKPAFARVQQAENFDCVFACIAMLCDKTLAEVKEVAITKFKHPRHGPYWVTESQIALLLAHYKFVSTVYKAIETKPLPEIAILLVDYDAELEIGRHALFNRGSVVDTKGVALTKEYVIDPAHWIAPEQQVRVTWQSLNPAWFIGIHRMKS